MKPPASEALAALVGRGVGDIDTPALVIDLDAMKRNIGRMAEFAKSTTSGGARTRRCTRAPRWRA